MCKPKCIDLINNQVKRVQYLLLPIMFFCFTPTLLPGQSSDTYLDKLATENFDPLVDNITDKLPPLEVLIDSAVENSPYIQFEDVETKLWKHKIKESKRQWLKNLGIDGAANYGNSYQFYTNQASGSFPTEFSTDRFQNSYSVGFYLRFPLFNIINQKNSVDIAKRESEKSILRKQQKVRETKEEVILVYEDLILRQELLKLINEAQITTQLQVEMAEQEFLNGNLSIADLSRLTERHTRNIMDYKKQSSLFYQQYLILEQLVGMRFNLLNEIY